MYRYSCGQTFSFLLDICRAAELLGPMVTGNSIFDIKLFSQVVASFSDLPAMNEGYNFSTSSPTLVISILLLL